MRKMRKILLGLGTIAMIGSPIIAVVSCSDDPTLTDFSYTYGGKAYADLESFGHDVFRAGTETEGKKVGIVHGGKTYENILTKEEVAKFQEMIAKGKGDANNLMLELASFVKLPSNIMTQFEDALNTAFPQDGSHSSIPPGPSLADFSYSYDGKAYASLELFGHEVFRAGTETEGKKVAIVNSGATYEEILTKEEVAKFQGMITIGKGDAYNLMLELASFVKLPSNIMTQFEAALKAAFPQDGSHNNPPAAAKYTFEYDGTSYLDPHTFAHAIFRGQKVAEGKNIAIDKTGANKYSDVVTTEEEIVFNSMIDVGETNAYNLMLELASFVELPDTDVMDYAAEVTAALNPSHTPTPPLSDFEFIYDGTSYVDTADEPALNLFGHAIRSMTLAPGKVLAIDNTKSGGTTSGAKYETTLTAGNIDDLTQLKTGAENAFQYMQKMAEIVKMTGYIQNTFRIYLRTFFPVH